LEPLAAEHPRTLALAAAGGRRLTDDELAALMERGAGNPLFLQRLASVGHTADEAEDLPETVEALVATRIDQLAPGDRALLRWASVLGVSFSGSLIAQVLEGDTEVGAAAEAWDRLGEFVERDPNVAGAFRVSPTARAPRSSRRGNRAAARRSDRGGRGASLAALLQRRALGEGVDVLAPRR
jgi:hypothetical protein